MPSHGGFGAWFRQNVLNQFRYATVKNHEQDESLARSPLELRRTIETLEHKRYPTSNQRTPKDSNATASEKTKYASKAFLPVTLRAPLLFTVAAASISLLVLLEVLSHKNARDGGIMFASVGQPISTGQTFTYLYLPTILSVIGGMIWSWIDLDVKRLEAYFQLSKDGGAHGSDSVLLSYPVDFLPLVPPRAARRRHWTVVAAGFAVLLMFWAITPLQAAIWGTAHVARSQSVSGKRSTGLTSDTAPNATSEISMGDPSNVTSFENGVLHNFLDRVYGIVWLNESFPAFTTSGTYYVVAPFTASNGNHSANTADATLTASTLLYETDLLCEPANIIPTPPTNSFAPGEAYNITNSQGFNIQIGGKPQGNGYHPTYATGVFESYCVGHPSSISQPGEKACGPLNTSFLATWQNDQKSGEDETKGLLAAFCKPTYYSQTADVTISQQNQSILSLTPSGERAPLDPLNFDQNQFATVVSSINIDQAARVVAMGLGYEAYGTVPTIIGIGLALTGIPHSQLPQSGNLETVLGTGYKLMFTLAAQTQISYNAATIPISMQQDTIVDAVVMVRAFAIVIEVLLGVIAAIAVLIFVLNTIRANKLQSDPHSLAYSMALSSSGASKPLLDSLSMHEMATETQLDTAYRDLRFVLREGTQSPIRCLSLLSDHPKQSAQEVQNVSNDSSEAPLPRITKPAYMVQLSWAFGIPFVVTLALLIVALSILRYFNGKYQGFTSPSTNSTAQQLLFNYLPTTMATFIEPLWVSIIRVLSILMPMEELRRGKSKFKASVGANYVSLPPQLLFMRALRSRQFLLSMTCVMALLSSLLAVAFSGLFQQVTIAQGIQTPMKHSFIPFLQSVGLRGSVDASQENSGMLNLSFVNANTHWDYVDPFYVVDANITRGLSLPPWTTSDYYFVSFDVDKLPANADGSRSAVTQGFGIDVPCITSDHSSNYGNVSFEVDISSDGQNNLTTSHVMGNGSRYDCHSRYTLFDDSGGVALRFQVQANPAYLPLSRPERSGPHAVETVIGMTATSNLKMTPTQEQAATCAQEIAVAWFRADFTEQANQAVPSMSNERSLLLMCYPRLKIAQFEVSVDSSGGVTSYAQTGPFVADTTSYYDGPAPRALTDTIALLHGTIGDVPNWHSDTAAYDWLNYFIKIKTNSSDITDPLKPLPDPTKISPLIEDIVRRVFTSSLSLNQNATFKLMDTQQVIDGIGALHGTIWVQVDRWVISDLMFTIALTILILMLLVAVAVFVWRPARFLPRIPTSIASQMAYFASSSIMGDMRRMDQSSRPQEKETA